MYSADQKQLLLQNSYKKSTVDVAGDKLGTHYLTDNPQLFEIQRSNNFVFYIEGLSKTLNIPQNSYAYNNADDVLRISLKKGFVPHFKISPITVKRGNNEMKFAGNPTFDAGTIELDDFIGASAKDVLVAWQAKAYNVRTEKVGLASDYKRLGYLMEYTPDYQLVRTWKLEGCWCGDLSEGDYSHDSADKHSITATINYDKAYIDIDDVDE